LSKVLITGSNGFIGQFLSQQLVENGDDIMQACRHLPDSIAAGSSHFAVGNIDDQTDWQGALSGVGSVVHLAARVHVMKESQQDPLTSFRLVNTAGTLNLARQAVAARVKRFIYISSIKVNGEHTPNAPFRADDSPNPLNPYAISKFEAEQQLLALSKETGLEVVIIRPPLVYGPEVKGNFRRLIKLVATSMPLPLAGIDNSRSLVNVQNLCSLIQVCLLHPKAAGEVFLVSDGQDLSTTELVQQIAMVMGKKSRLFYLPATLIRMLTRLFKRSKEYDRLFGSLQVDISKNEQLLAWKPEVSVQQGIRSAISSPDKDA